MTNYYVSVTFPDVPEEQLKDLVFKIMNIRYEYSFTVFKDEPENSDKGEK